MLKLDAMDLAHVFSVVIPIYK